MAVIILFMAPDYLRTLVEDPIGPYMIALAVGLQITGYFVIRRIINIKV
jgi:tight adherence protein B